MSNCDVNYDVCLNRLTLEKVGVHRNAVLLGDELWNRKVETETQQDRKNKRKKDALANKASLTQLKSRNSTIFNLGGA